MALVETAAAGLEACRRQATVLQLRAPARSTRELELEALELIARSAVPVLVSSRADLALATGAAGVNLPAADLPPSAARRLLGPELLVGVSAHSLEAVLEAGAEGADYVLFGPIFETPTHAGRPGLGLDLLRRAAAAVPIPVLAIGGVSSERIGRVMEAGASGFAAISHFRS